MTAFLRRVTIERLANGRWMLTRERDENGERADCDDLIAAFAFVRRAYFPNGEPRPWPPEVRSTPAKETSDD